jgi:putative transposase
MPRRPRIHLDGVPLYIVQRRHNREPSFFAEEDYNSYLNWLDEAECALPPDRRRKICCSW